MLRKLFDNPRDKVTNIKAGFPGRKRAAAVVRRLSQL